MAAFTVCGEPLNQGGDVLDIVVQSKRDKRAAKSNR